MQVIQTKNAPAAIGTYSQAIQVGYMVYLSGQIGLDPSTGKLVSDDFTAQLTQIFHNVQAVVTAAGGSLAQLVKLQLYLLDMSNFAIVNEVMSQWFNEPYPARAAVGVAALPKGALIEIDGIMVLESAR